MDAVFSFRKAMVEAGIEPPSHLPADGELHRFHVQGDKTGSHNGWYVLYLNGIPSGTFGCWKRNISEKWCAKKPGELTPEEQGAHRKHMEAARRKREAARRERQEEARESSQKLWQNAARNVKADHPYLISKGVRAFGLRQLREQLLVPMRDSEGTLWSLQTITEDGEKRYRSGGRKQGCYHAIGTPKERLYICEGYATGASIREATGEAVAIAFDTSNLKSVAETLRAKFPNLELVIAADNDHATEGNPGISKGKEAAAAVGAPLAFPGLSGSEGTDFNDLAALRGLEAVRKTLETAGAPVGNGNIEKQEHNTGEDEAELERLATLSLLEYERQRREAAEALGVGVSRLDKLVNQKRKVAKGNTQSDAEAWEVSHGIEPWEEVVDGRQLAATVRNTFNRFCILPAGGDVALTLWTLGTYCYNAFSIFPKLLFSSPEKRCGKSTAMEALASLAHRALPTSNTSAAAIFRSVEKWAPSLLIDEADTFLNSKDNNDMVGIINSGHKKSGAYVLRVIGDDHEPKRFSTWAPMAIAMIKAPRDTIKDRSVTLELRRKLESEKVQRLPVDLTEKSLPIRRQCLRWANDHRDHLSAIAPEVPRVGNDRAEDNWLSMLAIADALGGDWPTEARQAMAQLESQQGESQDAGTMLLSDIRTVFEDAKEDRLFTQGLITALVEMEERPWSEWRGGKPITTPSLAKLLKPYGIRPKKMRKGYESKRGFELSAFEDAFSRYLTSPPFQGGTTEQPTDNGASSVPLSEFASPPKTASGTLKPMAHAGCSTVPGCAGGAEEKTKNPADDTPSMEELTL